MSPAIRPVLILAGLLLLWPDAGAETAMFPDTLKIWTSGADQIAADPLGNIYLVRGETVIKYGPEGDSLYSWSDPQAGRITLADCSDPMRILVYHQSFNQLVFLNNRLAPLSEPVRLDDAGLPGPVIPATSRQGGFWIFDSSYNKLKRFDHLLNLLNQSGPVGIPGNVRPSEYRLTECGDRVYLLVPDTGILVFDLFANLIGKLPIKALSIGVYGEKLLWVNPEVVMIRDGITAAEEPVYSDSSRKLLDARLVPGRILLKTDGKVLLLSR